MSPGEVFYYADEFNISWHPTIRALWSPRGQQVMIPTPMQPTRRYGLGAANWHTGETVYRLLRAGGIHLNRPQHTITSPDPEYALKKRRSSAPATD